MKREPDLMIELLKECEQAEDSTIIAVRTMGMDTAALERLHHVELMNDAGLVAPLAEGSSVYRITNTGHDFLGASRNPNMWKQVKGWIREGLPLVEALARIASHF